VPDEPLSAPARSLAAFQRHLAGLYGAKDAARGDAATFLWFIEEVGELATSLRSGSTEETAREMADVLAWLVSLANLRGIDLEAAAWQKYGLACPGCQNLPCTCKLADKP
jgi:NTP pyrophosphatase (non-canonical NTP hydrolase)